MDTTHTRRLPNLLFKKNSDYRVSGGYLIGDVDKEEADKHTIDLEGGGKHIIYIPSATIRDERRKHPRIGTIYGTAGDTCFGVGEKVICRHNAFRRESYGFDVFWTDEDGNHYFRVPNTMVIASITEKGLVPRDQLLICTPLCITDYDGSLYLPGSEIGYRRDVVVVHTVGNNCLGDYSPGDILLLEDNADYPLHYNGKDYVVVSTHGDFEIKAKLDSPKWGLKNPPKHQVT